MYSEVDKMAGSEDIETHVAESQNDGHECVRGRFKRVPDV